MQASTQMRHSSNSNLLFASSKMNYRGEDAWEQKRLSSALQIKEKEGTISGYASLFDQVDLGNDRVAKGAFSKSLKKRKARDIRMLFQHDPSQPIGVWEVIEEDELGLFVHGRIVQSSQKGAQVLNLLREGALDGLSIGFRTEKSRKDKKSNIRTILEADLWEISIVTFPMLPQARISHVKQASPLPLPPLLGTAGPLPSVREFERWLMQDAGFSRSQARTVIGKGFAQLARKQDATGLYDAALAARMRRAAAVFNTSQ